MLLHRSGGSGDAQRYFEQAEGLLSGHRYSWPGGVGISPPPGYPIFLAAVLRLFHNVEAVYWVQFVLSTISCYLVYIALRKHHKVMAVVAVLLMCASPFTGRMLQQLLSETFSIFLSSIVVYCLSIYERNRTQPELLFLLGLTSSVLLMTTPATLLLVAGLFLILSFLSRLNPRAVGALWLGGFIVIAPWQKFCWEQTGRLQPGIYFALPQNDFQGGFNLWLRTWSRHEGHISYLWMPQTLKTAPSYAFSSAEEKSKVLELVSDRQAGKLSWDQADVQWKTLANQRKKENLFSYYVKLPAIRAVTQWMNIAPWWRPDLFSAGWSSLIQRHELEAKIRYELVCDLALLGFHAAELILFAYFSFHALRSRNPIAIFIVLALIVYTVAGAYTAMGEERRNFPFYPFLYLLAAWAPSALQQRRRLDTLV